jgi:hypothetical protein
MTLLIIYTFLFLGLRVLLQYNYIMGYCINASLLQSRRLQQQGKADFPLLWPHSAVDHGWWWTSIIPGIGPEA